jgi:AcrR family transcriptional regulator
MMDHRIEVRAGRPPKEQAEALGDHVVAVADALFIEKGYGATSMATVATASKRSIAASRIRRRCSAR